MKNMNTRLTQSDRDRMWGEEGPYSETNIKTQSRILGVSVSRVFLVAEAYINPFTFEYVAKNLKSFPADHPVHNLIKNASYEGGSYGYVVQAGQEEFIDQRALRLVHGYMETLTSIVIEMHEFVIAGYGLKRVDNHARSRAAMADNKVKKSEDFDILKENVGVLYHSILPWKNKNISDDEIEMVLSSLSTFTKGKNINVADLEYAVDYLRITFAMPADIIEAEKHILEFIDIINNSLVSKKYANMSGFFRRPLLKATERPSFQEIETHLKSIAI